MPKNRVTAEHPGAARTLELFDRLYPDASCALLFGSPFELLAATILSAQCTDQRVNQTMPGLLARYPDPRSLAASDLGELEALIRPCGFYRHKARNLQTMSRQLMERHGGRVPETLEELTALAGVGRKTAFVVLGNAFGRPGLTVDTHLGRVSRRLGLTSHQDPGKVEADLARLIPEKCWTLFSHQAIAHGRALCRARKPLCGECPLSCFCPRIGV